MKASGTTYYKDLPFEEYLKLPGTSYSSLKGERTPTAGMRLGTRVHNYINEPATYDWKDADLVLPIASQIKAYVGDAFKYLEKEVAFTSNFFHNGLMLKYKGRADMLKIGRIVIDLKILSGPLDAAIERFGYKDQISGYCLATGSQMGLIIALNNQRRRVESKLIIPDAAFWEYQCVRLGGSIHKQQTTT